MTCQITFPDVTWIIRRMKVLLFTLIRAFEFQAAVAPEDVKKVFIIVTRPILESESEKGNQLPMLIKPYQAA